MKEKYITVNSHLRIPFAEPHRFREKNIEENGRMEMTRDLFKIIGDVKGRWHTKIVKIKNRNGKD